MNIHTDTTPQSEKTSYWQPPFRQISEMEEPMTVAQDLTRVLLLMAQAMDEQDSRPLNRIAMLLFYELETAEKLRGEVFYLLHPNREEIDRRRAEA